MAEAIEIAVCVLGTVYLVALFWFILAMGRAATRDNSIEESTEIERWQSRRRFEDAE